MLDVSTTKSAAVVIGSRSLRSEADRLAQTDVAGHQRVLAPCFRIALSSTSSLACR